MNDAAKRRWSYASAAAIVCVTTFVFAVFQNFGPESAVRRFHAIGNRIASYMPPGGSFPQDCRTADLEELAAVTVVRRNSADLRLLMQDLVLAAAWENASNDIVRLDYQTPTLALAVVKYTWPAAQDPRFYVWVVRLTGTTWRVDPEETVDLWMKLRVR